MIQDTGELERRLGVERFESHFQPIINLRSGKTFGYEALLRGRVDAKSMRSPRDLFDDAAEKDLRIELERKAREVALRSFAGGGVPRGLLFLNFSAWILDHDYLMPGLICSVCKEVGLAPERVAIEIVESNVSNLDALKSFAERNRQQGFSIALDDFGTQHSNLERVSLVRPSIIKIDRSIVSGVSKEPYRRSVLRSVIYLAHIVGALALAEGVEEYEDLLVCAREGADLAQGYLIARPAESVVQAERDATSALNILMPELRGHLSAYLSKQIAYQQRFGDRIGDYVKILSDTPQELWERVLNQMVRAIDEVECAFLVRPDGIQITGTILSEGNGNALPNACFQPAEPGESHALKDYIYGLATIGHDRYISDPYVSLASGNLVRTHARRIAIPAAADVVMCVDIVETVAAL